MTDAIETAAAEATNEQPTFVDPSGRLRAFPLKFPVTFRGKTYSEVFLARLTVAEVAAFFESIKDSDKHSGVAWPIYRDADGAPVPQEVLDSLDDDDGLTIERGMQDFLPRRLLALMEGVGGPAVGEATGNLSAA